MKGIKNLLVTCIICFLFFSCTDEKIREDSLIFMLDGKNMDLSDNITAGQNMLNGILLKAGTNGEELTIILGNLEKKTYTEEDIEPLPPDSLNSTEDTAMLYAFANNNYFFYNTDSIRYTTIVPNAILTIDLKRYKYESTGKFEIEGNFSGTLYSSDSTKNDSSYIIISDGIFYYSNFN